MSSLLSFMKVAIWSPCLYVSENVPSIRNDSASDSSEDTSFMSLFPMVGGVECFMKPSLQWWKRSKNGGEKNPKQTHSVLYWAPHKKNVYNFSDPSVFGKSLFFIKKSVSAQDLVIFYPGKWFWYYYFHWEVRIYPLIPLVLWAVSSEVLLEMPILQLRELCMYVN